MLAKLLRLKLFNRSQGAPPTSVPFYRPYADEGINFVYNLLFCDNPELVRHHGQKIEDRFNVVFADAPERETLERIGNDIDVESRIRVFAFNRLKAQKLTVPERRLLGMVIEMPQRDGLDTLAAFVDGRVRYINQSGKLVVLEATPPIVAERVEALIRVSQILVNRIGPWDKPRRPPPRHGTVRMSFLASDGLYFGEGPLAAMQRERFAAPVLAAFTELFLAVIGFALQSQKNTPQLAG